MTPPRKLGGGKPGGGKPGGGKPGGGKPGSGKPRSGKPGSGELGRSGKPAGGTRGSAKPAGARPRNTSRSGPAHDGTPHEAGARDAAARERRPATARPAGKRPTRNAPPSPWSKAGGTVAARDEGPMRVQRALARAGAVSRREADRAVADGRVKVNGEIAGVGQLVDVTRDRLTLDDRPVDIRITEHRWIVLHKPAAVMTTRRDPKGRTTVFDLVQDAPGLVYVGRLDFMTEGVLLLTTDGAAAHALTHPSREVERTYVATVQGDAVTAARLARRGVDLEDGRVQPVEVVAHPLGNRRWGFEVTITEGRHHEVRRLCEALDLEVERLVRTRFGPVRLGELPSGEARALTRTERDMLEALIGIA